MEHPNLRTREFSISGMVLTATDDDVVVHWPAPDVALLAQVPHRRCSDQCYEVAHSDLARLPTELSAAWVYRLRGMGDGRHRFHPCCLIIRGAEGHGVHDLRADESLWDYFYPGHPETNFVTLHRLKEQ